MQQSAGPPWADVDVNHLLSILMAGLRMGTPRMNTFSGDATPGKTKVSFDQCYHEVQCIKDHYPEAVVQGSILRSLKWEAVDMARNVGPTNSIDHILWKLSVIFGMVASFNILMQNFYKTTQGNNKKDPKSNPASGPQKDDGCGGATASQISPFLVSTNTFMILSGTCTVPLIPPIHN